MLTDQGKALELLSGEDELNQGGFKESLEKTVIVDGKIVDIDGYRSIVDLL